MVTQTGSNYLLDSSFLFQKTNLKEGEKIADLGCGSSGHFVFPAAKLVGGKGMVYAVDIRKHILESIQKRVQQENYNNIKTVWSDLEVFQGTNIETESLDSALLINTLFQSSKRSSMLKESVRLIKKNHNFLIVDWKNSHSPLGPPVESRVDPETLKKAAPKLGLKLEEEFNAGDYHFGLLFTKI